MGATGRLAEPITRFITEVSDTLDLLANSVGRPPGALVSDPAAQAWPSAAAVVAADGAPTHPTRGAPVGRPGHSVGMQWMCGPGECGETVGVEEEGLHSAPHARRTARSEIMEAFGGSSKAGKRRPVCRAGVSEACKARRINLEMTAPSRSPEVLARVRAAS